MHVDLRLCDEDSLPVVASKFNSNEFDVVFVDCNTHHRMNVVGCVRHAVTDGGWMVIDDTDKPKIARGLDLMSGWTHTSVRGPVRRTDGLVRDQTTSFFRKVG